MFHLQFNKVYFAHEFLYYGIIFHKWKITIFHKMHYKTDKTLCDKCMLFIHDKFHLF